MLLFRGLNSQLTPRFPDGVIVFFATLRGRDRPLDLRSHLLPSVRRTLDVRPLETGSRPSVRRKARALSAISTVSRQTGFMELLSSRGVGHA